MQHIHLLHKSMMMFSFSLMLLQPLCASQLAKPKYSIISHEEEQQFLKCAVSESRLLIFDAYLQTFGPELFKTWEDIRPFVEKIVYYDCAHHLAKIFSYNYPVDREKIVDLALAYLSPRVLALLPQEAIDIATKRKFIIYELISKEFSRGFYWVRGDQLAPVVSTLAQAGADTNLKKLIKLDAAQGKNWGNPHRHVEYERKSYEGESTVLIYLIYLIIYRDWEERYKDEERMSWSVGEYLNYHGHVGYVFDALIRSGADITTQDAKGESALSLLYEHAYSERGAFIWVKKLVYAGIDLAELSNIERKADTWKDHPSQDLEKEIKNYKKLLQGLLQNAIGVRAKEEQIPDSSADIVENVVAGYLGLSKQ